MQPPLTGPGVDPELRLPTSEELPCSDDTPVDNEYQNTIPNWLLAVLEQIWGHGRGLSTPGRRTLLDA
jgi:hypothetical protein